MGTGAYLSCIWVGLGTPPDESLAHRRAPFEHLGGFGTLLKDTSQISEAVVAPLLLPTHLPSFVKGVASSNSFFFFLPPAAKEHFSPWTGLLCANWGLWLGLRGYNNGRSEKHHLK